MGVRGRPKDYSMETRGRGPAVASPWCRFPATSLQGSDYRCLVGGGGDAHSSAANSQLLGAASKSHCPPLCRALHSDPEPDIHGPLVGAEKQCAVPVRGTPREFLQWIPGWLKPMRKRVAAARRGPCVLDYRPRVMARRRRSALCVLAR
jgi:hypothetical protein